MVATVHEPGRKPGDREPARLEDAFAQADAGNGTSVLVKVLGRCIPAQNTDNVLRHQLALANGVLGVGNAVTADAATAQIWHGADVAGSPGAIDDVAGFGEDAQVSADAQAAALFDGEVGVADDRIGHDPRGPDDGVRFERLARGQFDHAVNGGGQLGVEVHLGTARGQVLQNPTTGLERNLGHDAPHGLDQVEVRVLERQGRVVAQQRACKAPQFTEGLDTGEPTTDNDEGEQAVTLRAGRHGGCLLEVDKHPVADRDGFFDGLKSDCLVGDSRNGEGAADRTRGDHDDVVVQLPRLAELWSDGRRLVRVVDCAHLGRDDLSRMVEVPAKPNDSVPGFDRPSRDLRKEGLVRHIWQRVNHDDFGFATTQQLFQLQCGVETGISAADNEDFWHDLYLTTRREGA